MELQDVIIDRINLIKQDIQSLKILLPRKVLMLSLPRKF